MMSNRASQSDEKRSLVRASMLKACRSALASVQRTASGLISTAVTRAPARAAHMRHNARPAANVQEKCSFEVQRRDETREDAARAEIARVKNSRRNGKLKTFHASGEGILQSVIQPIFQDQRLDGPPDPAPRQHPWHYRPIIDIAISKGKDPPMER